MLLFYLLYTYTFVGEPIILQIRLAQINLHFLVIVNWYINALRFFVIINTDNSKYYFFFYMTIESYYSGKNVLNSKLFCIKFNQKYL